MKAVQVTYDPETDTLTVDAETAHRDWRAVCEAYFDDVHRLRDVHDHPGYSGLYVCYDENNRPSHFIVSEGDELLRLRHRTFLKKLGKLE